MSLFDTLQDAFTLPTPPFEEDLAEDYIPNAEELAREKFAYDVFKRFADVEIVVDSAPKQQPE
jgi:hypothetical protein